MIKFLLSVFRLFNLIFFILWSQKTFALAVWCQQVYKTLVVFLLLSETKTKQKYLTVWQSESSTLLHDPPHDFSGVNAFLTKPFMQNIILLENVNIQLNCKAVSLQTCIVLVGSGPRNWKPHRARDPQISWPLNTTIKTRHIHNKSQYQTEGKKSFAGV